jgi:hypothetical protein
MRKKLSRTPTTAAPIAGDECFFSDKEKKQSKRRQLKRKRCRTPRYDLSALDLTNPNDVFSGHQLLAALGLWKPHYDGLFQFACAVSMARRLARTNPRGYLVRIVESGLWSANHYGPAGCDYAAAKAMMRELDA